MDRIKIRLDTYNDVRELVSWISANQQYPIYITDGDKLRVSANSIVGVLYAMEFQDLYLESNYEIPSYLVFKYGV